ncbi:ubiquitin-like-specific protease 1 [Colletotrichum liriopes]|uniref:Ubiquitin-like-specific protease 1 n=1 Tax=Colletotrichum liriopes TaxID=708192 RepID=A0AA37H044_9PEZI|nr:ubiquitin-like-specific protease 1 [Colletotrichum liriopes]
MLGTLGGVTIRRRRASVQYPTKGTEPDTTQLDTPHNMTLSETLSQLNALAGPSDNDMLGCLWLQLRDRFTRDPTHLTADFARWATAHVNRQILNIVTAKTLSEDLARVHADSKSRFPFILQSFDLSLASFVFLFGLAIANSRPCNQAILTLLKSRPDLELLDLYDSFKNEPAMRNGRVVSEVYRFQRAAHSYSTIAPWLDKKKERPVERPGSKTSKARERQCERSPEVMELHSESSPEVARRASGHTFFENHSPSRSHPNVLSGKTCRNSPSGDTSPLSPSLVSHETESADALGHEDFFGATPGAYVDDDIVFGRAGEDDDDEYDLADVGPDQSPLANPATRPSTPVHSAKLSHSPSTRPPLPITNNQAVFDTTEGLSVIPEELDDADDGNESRLAIPEDTTISFLPSKDDLAGNQLALSLPLLCTKTEKAPPSYPGANASMHRNHKRSYSESALVEQSELSSLGQSRWSDKKRRVLQTSAQQLLVSTEATKLPAPAKSKRIDLQYTVASLRTLEPGELVNDDAIHTLASRLTTNEIGVIGSLTLASHCVTERGRLGLQPTMHKKKVLLIANHRSHWILFLWVREENVLFEFNPSPGYASSNGRAAVAVFLRWVYQEADLDIMFREAPCPAQTNNYDCGVYVSNFAEQAATESIMSSDIDTDRERVYMQQCLLTSCYATLRPHEITDIHHTLPERAEALLNLGRQKSRLTSLSASLMAGNSRQSSEALLSRVARNETIRVQQAALAGFIFKLHGRQRDTLVSAMETAAKLTESSESRKKWTAVGESMDGLLKAYAECPVSETDGVNQDATSARSYLETIKQIALLARPHLSAIEDRQRSSSQASRDVREAVHSKYLECSILILVLRYAVEKYRITAAELAQLV